MCSSVNQCLIGIGYGYSFNRYSLGNTNDYKCIGLGTRSALRSIDQKHVESRYDELITSAKMPGRPGEGALSFLSEHGQRRMISNASIGQPACDDRHCRDAHYTTQ